MASLCGYAKVVVRLCTSSSLEMLMLVLEDGGDPETEAVWSSGGN
jgi:hypothetical protein